MIHELRIYTLTPGKLGEYLKASGEIGRTIRGDRYGKFEGGWTTEFGTLNQWIHLWSFADLGERERTRKELAGNEAWTRDYLPKIRPLIQTQENKFLTPILPLQPPTDTGNVYELRWYRTHVGRAAEWLGLFKAVMPVREKYMRRVGLWQNEAGPLNEVVHMWVYKDLNERATLRAKLGQDPAWQEFLAKSAPLLQHMQAAVLLPASHSPMR